MIVPGIGRDQAMAVTIALVLAACHSPSPSIEAPTDPSVEQPECTGSACIKYGIKGECVRGTCILGGGHCSRNVDCSDGNPCTVTACTEGQCTVVASTGACTRDDDRVGTCVDGHCEWAEEVLCASQTDCPTVEGPCTEAVCVDGSCSRTSKPTGAACRLSSGQQGECSESTCEVDPTVRSRSCRVAWNYYRGYFEQCRQGLRYVLSREELRDAERVAEKSIADEVRYDMRVALVQLPAGGYNFVVHNRRDRTDVRGLCDPSFVAWNIAAYTRQTNWRSENLHVWLVPYEEGWGVATQGSRQAVSAGQRANVLGHFGVVDVKTFRMWLERAFRPLVE